MPISVVCQCGAKLNAKDELAGKAVKCPKCSQPIKIPAAGAASGAAPSKPVAKKEPKPAVNDAIGGLLDEIGAVATPQVKPDIACPKCGAGMQPGAILCVACGFNTKTNKQTASSSDGAALAKREEYFAQQAAKAEAQQAKVLKSGPTGAGGMTVAAKPEAELTALDYVFCILCGGIALVVSIIYLVTGNPKGKKMLIVTLAAQAVFFVIGFVLGIVMQMMAPAT